MVKEVSNLNSCDINSLLPAGAVAGALDPMTVCISAYDIIFEFVLDTLPLFLLALFYYLYCVHVYGLFTTFDLVSCYLLGLFCMMLHNQMRMFFK